MKWDYLGWKTGNVKGDFQFDWNSTLFTMINMAKRKSENKSFVLVVVPNHLKEIIEPNVQLLEENGHTIDYDLIYRTRDEDIIEVNEIKIEILNLCL
jgi:hypothetical protein